MIGSPPIDVSTPVVVLAPAVHLGVGHGIARSLGRLGISVYGVHGSATAAAARSRYWRRNFEWDFAASRPEQTVDRLLEIAQELGRRPILIPADDSTCLLVADNADRLAAAYAFPAQPPGLARELSSKRTMHDLCRRLGVPTPQTFFPASAEDVAAFARSAAFPVMLKGIDTFALYLHSGVRMMLVDDAETLVRLYERLETPGSPNLMLQEHIPGGSDAVWMLDGYFDGESNCRFGLTGQKLRQYPADRGVTSLGICVENAEVRERTAGLMKRLGYRGILDIGYKLDVRTGEYMLLDVNPRIGVSFRLFVDRAGVDVARALYLDLTGQPIPSGAAPVGRKWIVENFDTVTAAGYLARRRLGPISYLRSLRGIEEASWFAPDDPAPAVAMLTSSIRWVQRSAALALLPSRARRAGGRARWSPVRTRP